MIENQHRLLDILELQFKTVSNNFILMDLDLKVSLINVWPKFI